MPSLRRKCVRAPVRQLRRGFRGELLPQLRRTGGRGTGGPPVAATRTAQKEGHLRPGAAVDKKVTFGRVLLWIFFLPIMAIIAIWRSRRLKTPVKIVLTGLIVLALVLYYRPRGGKATPAAVQTTQRPAVTATERPAQPRVTEVPATKKPTATPKPTAKPTPKPTEDPTPKEYRNALAKAQLYVDMMYMSKARLHDQLTSPYGEGFSEEAAQYALEHVKADWKKNALMTARNYRDNLHMSSAAIKTQLTSPYGEQFTQEEAQYAMEHLDD